MRSSLACRAIAVVLSLTGCAADEEVSIGRVEAEVLVPPDDALFVPFTCDGEPAFDPLDDAPEDHRNVVGDAEDPPMYRASDDTYLYLRLRLDGEPGPTPDLKSHGWGFLFDNDGVLNTYEILANAT